jgi:hypothetical protein
VGPPCMLIRISQFMILRDPFPALKPLDELHVSERAWKRTRTSATDSAVDSPPTSEGARVESPAWPNQMVRAARPKSGDPPRVQVRRHGSEETPEKSADLCNALIRQGVGAEASAD